MSEKGVLGTNIITQVGILVHDIEKTAEAYAEFLGIEKPQWSWTGNVEEAQTEFNGERSEARAKLAFISLGSVQLELIEPDQHPSTWRNDLEANGEGPHHIAFVVNGLKKIISTMDNRNMPLIQKGEYEGGRYAYMDTKPELKVLIELLEND